MLYLLNNQLFGSLFLLSIASFSLLLPFHGCTNFLPFHSWPLEFLNTLFFLLFLNGYSLLFGWDCFFEAFDYELMYKIIQRLISLTNIIIFRTIHYPEFIDEFVDFMLINVLFRITTENIISPSLKFGRNCSNFKLFLIQLFFVMKSDDFHMEILVQGLVVLQNTSRIILKILHLFSNWLVSILTVPLTHCGSVSKVINLRLSGSHNGNAQFLIGLFINQIMNLFPVRFTFVVLPF